MLIKALLLLLLLFHINAGTCGGNCPAGDCTKCYCGNSKNVISLENYCYGSSVWNQACCRCIASRVSGGNSHFMDGLSSKYIGVIGVMGLYDYDYDYLGCGVSNPKEYCDQKVNVKCAEKQYLRSGWDFWSSQAKACGCPVKQGSMLQTEEMEKEPTQTK